MTNKTGISLRVAAMILLDRDYSIDEIQTILSQLEKPTIGYIYSEQLPQKKVKI